VTLQRQAEDALRQANETLERRVDERTAEMRLLATIVETTGAFIQATDTDYNVLAINHASANEFERLFGVPLRVGDNLREALADRPLHQAEVVGVWRRALAGEGFTVIQELGDPASGAPPSS